MKHDIAVVVDRLVIKDGMFDHAWDSVETALREGEGKCIVAPHVRDGQKAPFDEQFFLNTLGAPATLVSRLEPNSFSFNSPVCVLPAMAWHRR